MKTLDAHKSKDAIIKPGEIIDVREVTPLTLQDRRIYNMLIDNAWDKIGEKRRHVIPKRFLRGSHNVNDRLDDSFRRLMGAIVEREVMIDDEPGVERFQILGTNCEHHRADGLFYYSFPDELRALFRTSEVWARLKKEVVFSFKSKYSLALYELVAKRVRMSYKKQEEFSLDELRGYLGVPHKKLRRWLHFDQWALRVAQREVNEHADFTVDYVPVKMGRKVTGVRIAWQRKV